MQDKVKIAGVQMDPKFASVNENSSKIIDRIRMAAAGGATLIVFPECALTGYMFTSRAEAFPFAQSVPGPFTEELALVCRELGVHVVAGLLEKEQDSCFNAAVLVGPGGLIGKYRKNHLPFLGIDRFLDSGNQPFRVFETAVGRIGLFICYDCTFPESSRVMALSGAEILALPTNWPEGRAKVPQYIIPARAYENKVHLVAVDRVGQERGAGFLGKSKIVDAWGDVLAEAGSLEEEIIFAEVSLADAREKHVIIKAGQFEADFIHDRKPHLYGKITE